MTNIHLAGLKAKMTARDKRRAEQKEAKAPNGHRFKVPASPKPRRDPKVKRVAGPPGEPGSRARDIGNTGPGKPQVNRRTGKPHEHRREIERRQRRAAQ